MSTAALQFDRAKLIPFLFDEPSHTYTVAGKPCLSSTQVLDLLGYVNFDMVDPAVLDHKRQIGKLVHQLCHFYDEGDLDETIYAQWPVLLKRLAGYKNFRQRTGYVPFMNEGQMIAECCGMHHGMTFDSIGYTSSGALWLVDLKNASGPPKRAWALQLASYVLGLKRVLPISPQQVVRVTVQLDDESEWGFRMHSSADKNSKIFRPYDYQLWPNCLAVAMDLVGNGLVKRAS